MKKKVFKVSDRVTYTGDKTISRQGQKGEVMVVGGPTCEVAWEEVPGDCSVVLKKNLTRDEKWVRFNPQFEFNGSYLWANDGHIRFAGLRADGSWYCDKGYKFVSKKLTTTDHYSDEWRFYKKS